MMLSSNQSPEPTGSAAAVQSATPLAVYILHCRWLGFGPF
jgi:hypothetical protein